MHYEIKIGIVVRFEHIVLKEDMMITILLYPHFAELLGITPKFIKKSSVVMDVRLYSQRYEIKQSEYIYGCPAVKLCWL